MLTKTPITEMQRLDREGFSRSPKMPLTIILDNVRSMHNVGSIFRTADAFRLERVILCGITAYPPHAEIHKTALGAEDSVLWAYYSDTLEPVRELVEAGYKVYALEQTRGSISLEQFRPTVGQRYALIVGNEVHGIGQEAIDLAGNSLEIPQLGVKHSMNVSVATGIAIWQIVSPLLDGLVSE